MKQPRQSFVLILALLLLTGLPGSGREAAAGPACAGEVSR